MMISSKRRDAPNWHTVFGLPIVIGLLSLAGLIRRCCSASWAAIFPG
jgi:hypothetical protein